MQKRWNIRRITIVVFVTAQIMLLLFYFFTKNENITNPIQHNLKNPVVFIFNQNNTTKSQLLYYNENDKIVLVSKQVKYLFEDFNSSLCYKEGTDLKLMKRQKSLNWKCMCLPSWHGNECGQPEVIWRALLASKKALQISGRKIQRRLIYLVDINVNSDDFTEILLNELKDEVDLFILFVSNLNTNFRHKLNRGFLRQLHSKILYISAKDKFTAWMKAKHAIRNLREDDIFFISNPFEIPNVKALKFLKIYDNWPQPLNFRLRWSVYGFFWTHPEKTILSIKASTINYFRNNFNFISNDNNSRKQSFIIGDLNYFGGWFCEFCFESTIILNAIKFSNNSSILNKTIEKKIDLAYLEDLIENGLYVDGKTELIRAHRSNENYYAPNYIVNNNWKYDWLLINLYSKLDYY